MTLKAKLIGMTLLAMSVIGFMTAMTVGMARTSSSTISRVFNEVMVPALALGSIDTSLRRIHNRILGTLTDYYPFEGSRLALAESKGTIQGSWELINESGTLALLNAEEREQFRRIEAFLPKLWEFTAELDKILPTGRRGGAQGIAGCALDRDSRQPTQAHPASASPFRGPRRQLGDIGHSGGQEA